MATRAITDVLALPKSSIKIPQLGFGVYRSPTSVAVQSCLTALEVGYRHIDTAQFYGNEKEVGEAVARSGLARPDVFLTTKIISPAGSVAEDHAKCLDSVRVLDPREGGYVDLFLIHSPKSGPAKRREMWAALEQLHDEGRARSIGVSNFGIKHIEELKEHAKVWPPHVNQIELHPWNQQKEIVEYCEKNGIVIEAYCPIVRNRKADDPTVAGIAKKYGVTPNQVLIRYCLQRNWVPLPKSDNADRIRTNADIYGFDLAKEDMDTLNGLDQGPKGAIVEAVENY